jgi:dTDP-4-dehydrorhamnose reductase
MRILLIGRTGQLGGDLLRNRGEHAIEAPTRDELDVTSREAIDAAIRPGRYDWVVHTAAFHDVPRCEVEPEAAFRVNCVAVRDVAAACARADVRLLTFSTDYVFGGDKGAPYREDDAPGPVQIYGITRLAGEQAARAAAPRHALIVRTCGLYGRSGAKQKGGNFVERRVEEGSRGESIEMSCEQTVSPTSTDDLSRAVLHLLEHPAAAPGVYHLVNEGACTWHDFTRAIWKRMGFTGTLRPVDRGGRSGAMRRPLFSALANTRAAALGIVLPRWEDALARFLDLRYPPAPGAPARGPR